jgi:hypothetical protein
MAGEHLGGVGHQPAARRDQHPRVAGRHRPHRDSLRRTRSSILAQAEQLAKAGIALEPRLEGLDAALLGHTMLSFAEMLGRLAVNDPDGYPRERLEPYAAAAMRALASG